MAEKVLVLVTGANQGIGRTLVEKLASSGTYHVILSARDAARGEAAKSALPQAAQANVTVVQLDITSPSSVTAAAEKVRGLFGHLDVLVNNAGVFADTGLFPGVNVEWEGTHLTERLKHALDTNVLGSARVTEEFTPLLRKSTAQYPRIIFVSSVAGSIGSKLDPAGFAHRLSIPSHATSKAAMNMLVAHYAMQFEIEASKDPDVKQIRVNAVCPGGVSTNVNNYRPTPDGNDGSDEMLRLIAKGGEITGSFTNKEGVVPW